MKLLSFRWMTALLIVFSLPVIAQPRRLQTDTPRLSPEAEQFLEGLPIQAQACNIAGTLSCGSSVTGSANACNDSEYYADFWIFTGLAGQTVTATVTNASTIYDVLVAIQNFDSGGEVLKHVTGRGSATITFTPTITKQYSVTVGYVTKYYSRSYNLNFSCGSSGSSCQSSGVIARGVTVMGSLTSNNPCNSADYNWVLYEFDGTEGLPVRIRGTATFPLYMEANSVAATTGTYKLSDLLNPTFVYYPETTGVQELWISHDGQKSTGQFTLSISDEPLAPCRRRAVRH